PFFLVLGDLLGRGVIDLLERHHLELILDFEQRVVERDVVLEDVGNGRLLENRLPRTFGLAGSAIDAFVGTHADASGVNAIAAKAGNRPRHGWQSLLKSKLKSISI